MEELASASAGFECAAAVLKLGEQVPACAKDLASILRSIRVQFSVVEGVRLVSAPATGRGSCAAPISRVGEGFISFTNVSFLQPRGKHTVQFSEDFMVIVLAKGKGELLVRVV
jgi:hypothetical protein